MYNQVRFCACSSNYPTCRCTHIQVLWARSMGEFFKPAFGEAWAEPSPDRPFTRTHHRESEKSKTPFQPILAGIGGAGSTLTMNSHDSCSVAKSS